MATKKKLITIAKKPKKAKTQKVQKPKVKKDKTGKEKRKTKNIVLISIMSILIFFVSVALIFGIYIIISAPEFNPTKLYNKEASVLYDKDGNEIGKIGTEKRDIVSYDELPQVLIDAIVATEDSRFFQHGGFDVARFAKATFGQLTGNSAAGGGSTLTMQVVKNTFTSKEARGIKGIIRKFTDIYMSIFKVEKSYTKEEIIEFYVNGPWLGTGSWGVEQFCQTYFGKSVRDISLPEAALVAGLFQNPVYYNPFNNPELAQSRRNTVLSLMVRHGYITEEQKEIAASISVESLLTDDRSTSNNHYQGFIDTVAEEIMQRYGKEMNPYNVPMKIQTTMDRSVQNVVSDLMEGKLYTFVNDIVETGIAVTDVNDGGISAIGPGRSYKGERQFNRATMINRHPGSTAKPVFDYGPLIEYNNASTYYPLLDEVYTYSNGTSLKNVDSKYMGLMTARMALAKSRNIPAVRVFQQVDPKNISEFVHNLGIDYGDTLYESCAIGGFEGVSPLTQSAAFAAFGRGGYYIEPYSFTKITLTETNEEIEYKPKKIKVMGEDTAYMINSMLMTATSQGVAGSIRVSGTNVASKSGTSSIDDASRKKIGMPSSAAMDAWLNVYSPDYSISIWYGYDKLSKDHYITSNTGNTARKKISTAISNKIFKKNSKFDVPSNVVSSKVELETFPAMLPSEHTPAELISTELFKAGTEPTEVSPRFDTLENPTNGKASVNGNQVTLTWDKISTPQAIDTAALQTHFNTYYTDYAEKYYEKRITYNNSYIGTVGYQVYLQNESGALTSLGYTANNSYTYTMTGNASSYKFVIKASYSIFKNNMSTGLTIEVKPNGGSSGGTGGNDAIARLALQGDSKICVTKSSGLYSDMNNPLKAYNANNDDITDRVTIERKYYKNDTLADSINLAIPGNYKVAYIVGYNGLTYNTQRKINVCETGCNANKECN